MFFSQNKYFWRLRSIVNKVYFWIGTKSFKSRDFAREKTNNISGLRKLFKITQLQFLLAVLVTTILQIINPYVIEYYKLTFLIIPDDGDYVSFLLTISGIGGAFIGLYYTAVSTIAGSIYAKVPNNIRKLLAVERLGNVYMNFLSFVTFLGMSLVSLRVMGFGRIQLAVPIMLLGSGVGIIAFVKLGQRLFNLFDPTALGRNLFYRLMQLVKKVTAGEYRWNDKAFQNHVNKLASSNLDTLETLADITRKEIHLRGKPFISLCKKLISFLMYYENIKNQIPSNSQWYEQKYLQKDWYRSDETRVSIAHETGTNLSPDITNNKEWIEERLLVIIEQCVEVNLKEEKYNEVLEILEYIEAYLTLLAKSGRTSQSFEIVESLGNLILKVVSQDSKTELIQNEVLEKLAIIERFASIPINIAIASGDYINSLDPLRIEEKLNKLSWKKDSDIYNHGFPTYCLSRLEWFKPRLEFELLTDDKRVTPIWYQKELLLQIEADTFVENGQTLIDKGINLYKSWISITTETKHPWLVGALMSREWEFWHKVENQMETWSTVWTKISSDRKIEGLPWSNLELNELKQKSRDRQQELLELMSKQNLLLAYLKRPDGFPDYAGQFLHTSGEAVLEALLSDDQDLLKNIFPTYLYGCLQCFENLRPDEFKTGWQGERDIKIAAAPLLDLMDLSGYAKLMSDYHNNEELWQIIVDTWNEYLKEVESKSPLPLFAASVSLTESNFELAHRSMMRTNWKMRIERKLSDVPRHEEPSDQFFLTHTVIDHNSALIRIFSRDRYGSLFDGIDIFITYYLRTKKGGGELDFGRKRRDLQESLDRENDEDIE